MDAINVGRTGRFEHGSIASRPATECVARGIVFAIGFGLDDQADAPAVGAGAHQTASEQCARSRYGVAKVLDQCNVRGMSRSNSGISAWKTEPSGRCIS